MSFPCGVFINSVALRIVFLINTVFETLKSNKGPWDFFCHSTDENSIPVISTLFRAAESFNVLSFLLLDVLFNIIADAFYPAWHFCKVDFPKCMAARTALNFYMRLFIFYTPHKPCKTDQGRGTLSFCTLHRSLQLKRLFHNMRLNICAIAQEQSMRDVWGYEASRHRLGGLQRGEGAKPGVVSSILPFGNSPSCKVSEILPRHCLEDLVSHKKVMNHVNS